MTNITHTKVVATPDDGTSEVGTDEWNAAHVFSLAAGMPKGLRVSDDMLYSTAVSATTANTGFSSIRCSGTNTQSVAQVSSWPHVGIMSLDTGSTNAGQTSVLTPGTAIELGSGRVRYGAWVKTPPALSNGTDRYEIFAGFTDTVAAQSGATDACVLHYLDTVNSGKWELVTSSNTTQSQRDTAITVVAATWYFLEVEVNAAGTSVQAYINGAAAGAALTTNIPTGSSRVLGADVGIVKTVGTTASVAQLDAWYLELDFTTPR